MQISQILGERYLFKVVYLVNSKIFFWLFTNKTEIATEILLGT